MKRKIKTLVWHKLIWRRPFEFEDVLRLVNHIATTSDRSPLVFEIRAVKGKISYFLGTDQAEFPKISKLFQSHGEIDFGQELQADTNKRKRVKVAKRLNMTHPILSLKVDNSEALTRTTLATMAQVSDGDEIVLQLVLASSVSSEVLPRELPDPNASWLKVISGNIPAATSEVRQSVKSKVGSPRIKTVVRIGVYAKDISKAQSYILSVLSAFKMLETSGIKLNVQQEELQAIHQAKTLFKYPLKLSVSEIVNLLLLPTGESNFLGIEPLHPKILLPPRNFKNPTGNIRAFGETMNENPKERRLLNLSVDDSLRNLHTLIIGPSGVGKTTVLENLALADCEAGGENKNQQRGVIVLDPKFSLIESIVQKIPEHRLKDVVIWDISSNKPLGINILSYIDGKSPELVAESVLSSLRILFPEFGVYTEELLTCGLMTLARNNDNDLTLLHLPILFSNPNFRGKLISKLDDTYLQSFWRNFEALSEKERNQQTAPLLRRLNVLLMRSSLRGALGQAKPKFNLEEVFEGKILLVPLNSGLVGNSVSELCASLLINSIWNIALRRAELSEDKRASSQIMLYIDEFQSYVAKSGANFENILEMARSLGINLILANQHLKQLDSQLRESVLSNTKSKIIFSVSKTDAKVFADLAPELTEIDFMSLPQFQVYTTLNEKKIANVWLSGKTFPSKPNLRLPIEVFAKSAETYGQNIEEIEKDYVELINQQTIEKSNLSDTELDITLGRKKRQKPTK